MRISDWSSDVCSSDLVASIPALYSDAGVLHVAARAAQDSQVYWLRTRSMGVWSAAVLLVPPPPHGGGSFTAAPLDRKGVAEGTSVSVRVGLGGRRRRTQKRASHFCDQTKRGPQ